MRKITRDDIRQSPQILTNGAVDYFAKLFNQREAELQAQYGELVEAAAAYVEKYLSNPGTEIACNLKSATNACLPRSSPADRLDALAEKGGYTTDSMIISKKEYFEIVAELREGEND